MRILATVACISVLLATAAATAQPRTLTGEALVGYLPATLGGGAQTDRDVYSQFVTASYALDGRNVVVQIHDVQGAGSAAFLRSSCPRFTSVAGHEACVMPQEGTVSLTWVLHDNIQVMLGPVPDEATATRLAAELPFTALARLATH